MAFPNVTDIVATTIQSRSRKIADNVTKNNALFARLKAKGKVKSFSGGDQIFQELSFAENSNFGWYSGYDLLPMAASDVISAAAYQIKQCAAPVVISGLELLQNSGKEKMIDLLEERVAVAESTMANNLASGVYSDGTAFGGKVLTGLQAAVPLDPTTGTYGGINRATTIGNFWRSQLQAVGSNPVATQGAANNIQVQMNAMWAKLVRGKDRPDLIVFDNQLWQVYANSLQIIQRITDPKSADLGFPTLSYFGADVVLDGGIGGFCPSWTGWFLNTDYIFLRPHKDRDMVPLDGGTRIPTGQDAQVSTLAWAGNMTCSNASLQGYFKGS
jgi:hypothetical protein